MQVLILEEEHQTESNPCQLKKIWGTGKIACTTLCALEHGCPIAYIDSNDVLKVKPISKSDLEV